MKKKIKEIYEASCFKMDPIFVLEFDVGDTKRAKKTHAKRNK